MRLRERGVDEALTAEVAADRRLDLHALLNLLDRGCPADLALRILAPDDPVGPGA